MKDGREDLESKALLVPATPTSATSQNKKQKSLLWQKALAIVMLVIFTSSNTLLTQFSKNSDGYYDYDTKTVPLLSEILKALISSTFLVVNHSRGQHQQTTVSVRRFILFSVPAAIYFITNNINFFILEELDPASFQILNNLKVATTGVLFYLILKQQLSWLQWKSLFLLMVGTTVSQIGSCGATLSGTIMGYSLAIMNCWLSAFASIYTEKIMKNKEKDTGMTDSIHWQNLQMYTFGAVFASASIVIDRGINPTTPDSLSLLHGYDYRTCLVVLNYALVGLVTSAVVKFVDNIAKTFAAAAAMFFVAISQIWMHTRSPTLQLFLGMAVASVAMEQYTTSKLSG